MFSCASSRSFVVFSYNHSHGSLLLRSRKDNVHSTRVDILIQGVRAMEIRSWFNGIQIEEVDSSYLDAKTSKPLEMIEPGNCVYAVRGAGWNGYIVGGIARTSEDTGEYMDPSRLIGSKPSVILT